MKTVVEAKVCAQGFCLKSGLFGSGGNDLEVHICICTLNNLCLMGSLFPLEQWTQRL